MEYLCAGTATVIATTFGAWFTGLLNQFVPSPNRTWLAIGNLRRKRSRGPDDGIRIALCWLENDSRGIGTRRVENAFAGVAGITLVRSHRCDGTAGARRRVAAWEDAAGQRRVALDVRRNAG